MFSRANRFKTFMDICVIFYQVEFSVEKEDY